MPEPITPLQQRVNNQEIILPPILGEQVQVLSDTLQTSLQRMEVAFNIFRDRANELAQLAGELMELKGQLELGLEALHRSISESDSQIDDLAKITARVGQMEQSYRAALAQLQQQAEQK